METLNRHNFWNPYAMLDSALGTRASYNFYHDESHNHRAYYLTASGANRKIAEPFVLGGIVSKEPNPPADFPHLKKILFLQKNIKKIKFGHIAHGNLSECLKSKKLRDFLEWMHQSSFMAQFFAMDILYYPVIDIVDDLLINTDYKEFHRDIKNGFYEIVQSDEKSFLLLLSEANFPEILDDGYNDYLDKLSSFVISNQDSCHNAAATSLIRHAISLSRNKGNFRSSELGRGAMIENFAAFYNHRASMFYMSSHVFDRESKVERILRENGDLIPKSSKHAISFQKSEDNELLQVADIVVGFARTLYSHVRLSSLDDILETKHSLTSDQKVVMKIFSEIMDKSHAVCPLFFQSMFSQEHIRRLDLIFQR